MNYRLDDFGYDLRRALPPGNTWVGSGQTTVAATPGTVCGVDGVFAPPYAMPDAALRIGLEVDGRPVSDGARPGVAGHGLLHADATWRPDRIARSGTYHQYRDGTQTSLRVRSTLTPLHGRGGYVLQVSVHNRTGRPTAVALRPELRAGGPVRVPLADWGWTPPGPGSPAVHDGRWCWRSGDVEVALHDEGLAAEIAAGATARFTLAVTVGPAGAAAPAAPLAALAAQATAHWSHRLAAVLRRVPTLHTDVPGLAEYWLRSLASGLVCLWDNPDFATQPFVATSGIDGGALCAYAWDTGGYAPHLLTLMLGDTAPEVLEAMLKADLVDHYAIAPDGTGTGVAYAYTGWSLVTLAAATAAHRGISAGLVSRLYDAVATLDDRFTAIGELRDYGTQHNLLEMRGAGWEHVVASPNAERAHASELFAELATVSGAPLPVAALRAQAARIRAAVRRELWDADAGWFRARYPDGHIEITRSIQAYDALRAGVVTDEIAAALLNEIRPGAFLGDYGVSSVSAEDERHYELGDIDWSGGGAYTGEAPVLALTLWERGESTLAWEVLGRLLWMGRHFPYFPQEHESDRPAAQRAHCRANIVAGLAGAEAILTGLAGVRPQPDGSLIFRPYPVAGTVELRGMRFRGHTIDVLVSPACCAITVDGRRAVTNPGVPLLAVPAGQGPR